MQMASGSQYSIRVPDSTRVLNFPSSMTHEEVRAALVGSGYTAVESAELIVDGLNLTFRRVSGGSKGNSR